MSHIIHNVVTYMYVLCMHPLGTGVYRLANGVRMMSKQFVNNLLVFTRTFFVCLSFSLSLSVCVCVSLLKVSK